MSFCVCVHCFLAFLNSGHTRCRKAGGAAACEGRVGRAEMGSLIPGSWVRAGTATAHADVHGAARGASLLPGLHSPEQKRALFHLPHAPLCTWHLRVTGTFLPMGTVTAPGPPRSRSQCPRRPEPLPGLASRRSRPVQGSQCHRARWFASLCTSDFCRDLSWKGLAWAVGSGQLLRESPFLPHFRGVCSPHPVLSVWQNSGHPEPSANSHVNWKPRTARRPSPAVHRQCLLTHLGPERVLCVYRAL